MLTDSPAFSGFSVDDIPRAKAFYADVLGLVFSEEHGMLLLHLAGGRDTLISPKDDHVPATFTVLNLPVDDIAPAVAELAARGVRFPPGEQIGDDGVLRGTGPLIAWFTDPAGNVLSVIEQKTAS